MLLYKCVAVRPFVLHNVQILDESPTRRSGSQVWAAEQSPQAGYDRLSSTNGSLRPLFLLQPHQTTPIRMKNARQQTPPSPPSSFISGKIPPMLDARHSRTSYERGRSTSPPLRLAHVRGAARRQSSSPPGYDRAVNVHTGGRRGSYLPPGSSGGSSQSRDSPTRWTWHKEFQSAIPVPVGVDGRGRFKMRFKEPGHRGNRSSAPVQAYRTKSPISTRLSTESFNISQDSIDTHQISSGTDSSDNEAVLAESYLTVPSASNSIKHKMREDDSFDQLSYHEDSSENRSIQSPSPQRDRFITLDSASGSDFEDRASQHTPEQEEYMRSQIFQKLQDEVDRAEPIFRDRVSQPRLSKSHADLSMELKKSHRQAINSAPPVKQIASVELTTNTQQDNLNETIAIDTEEQSVQNTDEIVEFAPEIIKCPDILPRTVPKVLVKRKSEVLTRKLSVFQPLKAPEVFPANLRCFSKPKEGFLETVSYLESSDWENIMKGLQNLVRLVRNHADIVEAHMHALCVLLGRHIKNLRSQVARAACVAAWEMFGVHKKAMEPELEEITAPLLQRTADTNKFLRSDAISALDAMCQHCNTHRVVAVLHLRGVPHHNAVVRCSTARLYAGIIQRLGPAKFFMLPKDTREKVLSAAASMLTEGSLDTRKHAKDMFTQLQGHAQLQRLMAEAIPAATMRHIGKIINNLK